VTFCPLVNEDIGNYDRELMLKGSW